MNLRPLISLTAAVALVMPAEARAQVSYTYTRVAATGSGSGFAGLFPPSLNHLGTAGFGATLTTSGGSGIFAGSGGSVATIAQNGATFAGFNPPPGAIIAAINPTSNMNA